VATRSGESSVVPHEKLAKAVAVPAAWR